MYFNELLVLSKETAETMLTKTTFAGLESCFEVCYWIRK